MKAILEFNLPEENEEHLSAINGSKWKSIVWDIDQYLRANIKYSDSETEVAVTDMVRTKLHEILSDNDLSL